MKISGLLRGPAILLLSMWLAPSAPGQGPPIIRSIEVEYSGPATVSKERILAQIQTRVGEPYSEATVEKDIQNLYKTGAVLNVRIFGQPVAGGVKVIVAVQTRAGAREIEIDGAQKAKSKRLPKTISGKNNDPVNKEQLEKCQQATLQRSKAGEVT